MHELIDKSSEKELQYCDAFILKSIVSGKTITESWKCKVDNFNSM